LAAFRGPQLYNALDPERKVKWSFLTQSNRGKYTPTKFTSKLKVDVFDYKPNIGPIQKEADLIISHCGAGTLLECLRLKKKVCAVINETLMDNH
jgi:beta-1,4-N-acetylglucosaminyltransferase